MKETTIVDPGHAQRLQRRTDNKSGQRGNQLNFNPLHPSMELPPEQLIRLLGMESKKMRKSRKARRASKQAAVAPLKKVDAKVDSTPPQAKAKPQTKAKSQAKAEPQTKAKSQTRKRPKAVRPADSSIQYERSEPPQVFGSGRSGLLMPAGLVGIVAGIAISGYLFWYQPADTATQKAPAPAVAKQAQKPQPKGQLVKRTPAPASPATTPAPKPEMTAQEKVKWQTSVETQEQRLRATAQQRLAERVLQLQQVPRQVELQPALVNDGWPERTPEPVVAPEPVSGAVSPVDAVVEAPLETTSVPFPTAVETLDVQETTVEIIQPDTDTLPVTPGESSADTPAMVETAPESDDAATDELLDIEPATAAPVVSDIEPEAYPPAEADSVLTSVDPADESSVVPANNGLF